MTAAASARIVSIARYPVKGLGPDWLDAVQLSDGQTLPFDRAWAVQNGPGGFDPASPRHLPKSKFLMLMRNERLALLETRFDEASRTLTILRQGKAVVAGRLDERVGRQVLEQFFAGFMSAELRGPPRIVSADGHSFSDVPDKCVSIISQESCREIGRVVGVHVDPLRFRGNVVVAGLPAWSEFDWLGREIALGGARLEVFARIRRCAATNVDPRTGRRDLRIPEALTGAFGHTDCGLYARVVGAGPCAVGDPAALVASA